jgi:glycosyltransferase involved in cell wall biosynthesis
VIVHHVHGWGLQASKSRLIQLLYLNLERLCARFTGRLVAVSAPDIQTGLAHHIADEDKFALIYNGIELEKFRQSVDERQMRQKLGLAPDSKLVGMIGRLDRQKNPLDFIRAASTVARSYAKVSDSWRWLVTPRM